jgi:hypothetical protein
MKKRSKMDLTWIYLDSSVFFRWECLACGELLRNLSWQGVNRK